METMAVKPVAMDGAVAILDRGRMDLQHQPS
jgi:hypothetical protein